jgi:Ras-related GTP-binding protein C/D
MDKTFLFDIHSRIYVATDGSPIEQSTFDLCSDYLEKLLQFRALYRCASLAFRADSRNIKPSRSNKSRTATNSSLTVPMGDLTISNGGSPDAVVETEDEDGIGPDEDEEDPDAPWVTQSTRLLPNTTIAYWEFTPCVSSDQRGQGR